MLPYSKKYFVLYLLFLFVFSCTSWGKSFSELTVSQLKCEYTQNPLGIDVTNPRLSWELHSQKRAQKQTAYQILVASSLENLQKNIGDIWNTGKVQSEQSIQIVYQGPELQPKTRYWWKVRVWDNNNRPSPYSKPAWWETGLLSNDHWHGQWISAPRVFNWNKRAAIIQELAKEAQPLHDDSSPLFRKVFKINKPVKSARFYISGLGYYELFLNGKKIGDRILDPAFTNYTKRVLYSVYDVTEYIRIGENAIGVMLGNGWYNLFTRAVWSFDRAPWRNDPALLCQLEITFADGSTQTVYSDTSWKCAPGPISFNAIRQGETYDARLKQPGWNEPQFNTKNWYPVRKVFGPKGKLQAQFLPPVKIVKRLPPKRIYDLGNHVYVVDFGQNIAGFVELRILGKKGQKITIKYGERLNKAGFVDQEEISHYVRETRFQTDEYILKGTTEEETWHPHFTYHGFQYVEIRGMTQKPDEANISACLVHTAFDSSGYFKCSYELINKIQNNTLWSFVSNFHGYPTDCPHREKLGWLNDAQLASETGLFNFQTQTAYTKWINDIIDSQLPNGSIPPIVPTSGWGYQWNIGPAYDNAIILIPYNLYLYSGDKAILKQTYPNMKKYFKYYQRQAKDYLIDLGLGDWSSARRKTPKKITATAYYFLEAKLLSRIADLLKKDKEARQYAQLAQKIKLAFRQNFLKKEAIDTLSQTTLGCALYLGLVDSTSAATLLNQLITSLKTDTMNLDFGIIGAKTVPNALTLFDRPDAAYNFINNTRYPGWGYWIKKGATTLWETWDGEKQSLNHIMFGDISAWFYKTLAGLRPDAKNPGFKHFFIEPYFPKDIHWVDAEYQSPYGLIGIRWKKTPTSVNLQLKIPVNTNATLKLPAEKIVNISEHGIPIEKIEGLKYIGRKNKKILLEVKSGNYQLIVNLR